MIQLDKLGLAAIVTLGLHLALTGQAPLPPQTQLPTPQQPAAAPKASAVELNASQLRLPQPPLLRTPASMPEVGPASGNPKD